VGVFVSHAYVAIAIIASGYDFPPFFHFVHDFLLLIMVTLAG
jgi:hypothetical protein